MKAMINNSHYLHGRGGIITSCCSGEGSFFLSDAGRKGLALPLDMNKVIDQVIKNAHEGIENTPAQDRSIVHEQYGQLRDVVRDGLGKLSNRFEYGTPNQELAKNLQYNVGLFSAFKKHDMMQEVVAQLKDDAGNLKGYSQFRKDVLPIIGTYRESWLQTEYNTGVRSCRMAAQWVKFQAAKNLYPNLKFVLSRSAHRRAAHEALVGTILPIDHSFWSTHMPPLDWECKCSVTNTDEQPTETPGAVDVSEMFAFNPGKEGKVYNVDAHPYAQVTKKEYQDVTKAAWGALCSYERKQVMQQAKDSGQMKKQYKVPGLKVPIKLNRATFENNLAYDDYFFDKLSLLSHIDTVLEDSQVILVENRKPKQAVKQYHILQHLTNEGRRINLHIEERKTGEMFLHYIHIQK